MSSFHFLAETHVFGILKDANINVQQTENVDFVGAVESLAAASSSVYASSFSGSHPSARGKA